MLAPETMTFAGRLSAIAALVEAARAGEVSLGPRLEECFAGTVPVLGQQWGNSVVWDGAALVALSSERPPLLSVDGGEPAPMAAVPGTPYWFMLVPVEEGRVRAFSFVVEGESSAVFEIAGFTGLSRELPDARRGTLSPEQTVSSRVYPGATTAFWVYLNDGIDEIRGAPLMIWHDGHGVAIRDLFQRRVQIVTDNLVHLGRIPPMAHVCVRPSSGSEERATGFDGAVGSAAAQPMRPLQYATVSDRYGRHLLDELLPRVEKNVKLRQDAYSRGSAGRSDGGSCAFKLAWLQPDRFSRAHCSNATFTTKTWDPELGHDGPFIYEHQARLGPKRNVRVWLSSGTNDIERPTGSWALANIMLANALKLNGYDVRFRFDGGHHGSAQTAIDLPESIDWLWRDYDPDRTEQVFEQDLEEREKPPFRVSIVNR